MILLLWWLSLLLQAKWTNYVKMEIECCVCEGLQLLFLLFLQNIWISKIIPDDMMMAFVWLGSYFVPNIYIRNTVSSSNVLGFAFFYFPYSRAQFRLYFGVYHLISISVCIWKLCVHESTMKYSMFTTIYFIFGLNDTTTTCATAIVSSVRREIEWASERINHHKAFFVLQFSFAFVSVTIVIIQYKSLHFQPFYFRI